MRGGRRSHPGPGRRIAPVEEVDEFAEAPLVDAVTVEDARQCSAQLRVRLHHGIHRLIDQRTDGLLGSVHRRPDALGVLGEEAPPGLGRHPEHATTGVLVGVVDEDGDLLFVVRLGEELGADGRTALVEGIRHVLQEDQAENDVLVLRRIHRSRAVCRRLSRACPSAPSSSTAPGARLSGCGACESYLPCSGVSVIRRVNQGNRPRRCGGDEQCGVLIQADRASLEIARASAMALRAPGKGSCTPMVDATQDPSLPCPRARHRIKDVGGDNLGNEPSWVLLVDAKDPSGICDDL